MFILGSDIADIFPSPYISKSYVILSPVWILRLLIFSFSLYLPTETLSFNGWGGRSFTIIFIGFGYSQDNSSGSSGSPFIPLKPDSKKSLLNLKEKENSYLKNFEDKNKKNFFPDADVKEKKPERFINSNEFYLSRLNKKESEATKNINKFKVDQFLGEIRNDGEYVNIILRDHEYPDGDLIKVEVNEQIVMPAILLTEKAKGFKLDLKNGFNVVDFVALNQGTSGPNTAEIIVYDDQGKLVGTNRWNLATGVKATYIIYKN